MIFTVLNELERAYYNNRSFEGCSILSMSVAVHPDASYSIRFLLANSSSTAFYTLTQLMTNDRSVHTTRITGIDKSCIEVGINVFGERFRLHSERIA